MIPSPPPPSPPTCFQPFLPSLYASLTPGWPHSRLTGVTHTIFAVNITASVLCLVQCMLAMVTSLAALLLVCLSDNMCKDSLFDPTQKNVFKQACIQVQGSPYRFISPHAYVWSRTQRGLRCTADSGGPLMALPSLLKGLPDMERGITRIFHRTANPAEFVQVLQALVNIAPKLGVQVSCTLPTCGHLQHCQASSRLEARPT